MEPVASSMSAFITALTTGLTASTFYSVLTDIAPFVIMIVPVALGYYVVRKLIKGAGHAKVNF